MNMHTEKNIRNDLKKHTLWSFLYSFIRKQPILFSCLLGLVCVWPIDMIVFPYVISAAVDVLTHYEGDRMAVWSALARPVSWGLLLWIGSVCGYHIQGAC